MELDLATLLSIAASVAHKKKLNDYCIALDVLELDIILGWIRSV